MAFRRNKRFALVTSLLLTTTAIILVLFYHKSIATGRHQHFNVLISDAKRELPLVKRKTKKATFSAKDKLLYMPFWSIKTTSTSCPVLSIRDPARRNVNLEYAPNCKPWEQTEDNCKVANQYYADRDDIYCGPESKPKTNICSFTNSNNNQSATDPFRIHCDPNGCQSGRLFVGSIDPNYGIIPPGSWREFTSTNAIELALPEIIQDNIKNGFSFSWLRCIKNNDSIDQLLEFPQILRQPPEKTTKTNDKQFNINVVVLDSVSRNHFYRKLPKTVRALTQAAGEKTAEILDYELLQSLAPYTYTNVRAFMTGKVDIDFKLQENRTYGINNLFGPLKKSGYRTLLQEESCWYDYWGTVLGQNIRKANLPKDLEEFQESWRMFKKMADEYAIDDYGLTHFSCPVYAIHKVTNMFNEPLKICFDGKPYGSYTLGYVQNVFSAVDTNTNNSPVFSYLHSNTGHETTGLRIKAVDQALSMFVGKMANLKNTLTIILSDHGPKTTKYSHKFLHGRYETYDSFLFMIVPEKVQQKLGEERMASLIKNQKSLVSMADLHKTFMCIINESESCNADGLFSRNLSNRTCDSLRLINYGICKCKGWEKIFKDQSPQFIWLAEFAAGILNREIQQQFSLNNHSASDFGNCVKLRFRRIRNIRQRFSENSYITTFDMVVYPSAQIFLIQTRHMEKDNVAKNVELQLWRRVSIFRQFGRCKDPSVKIELCVCKLKRRSSKKHSSS